MDLKKYYNKSYKKGMKHGHREQYARRMLELVRRYKKEGRILELGSYDNSFVWEANKESYVCYGIDINPISIFGGFIRKAEITDLKQYKANEFDVVIGFNILEHIRTPAETLDGCKRILKKDGVLILSVPNSNTSIDLKSIICKEHLNYWNLQTLECLLERCGFKVVWWKTRLITTMIYKLLRKKGVSKKAFSGTRKKGVYDLIYKLLEALDLTSMGQDLMIVAKKKRKT